ncbi:MAG: non-ribosomal peptide synthetase, partial [Candidatus Methylumidiphilus sp.]
AEQGGQFHCSWEYATDLFEAETVERMAAHFEALLDALTSNPQQAIGSVPMLTEAEVRQLQAWNDTETDYPKDQTLVDLFEAQVEATPGNIAVVFEDQSLSYRQLNEKANRLAHHLLSLAKPDGQPLLSGNPLIAIAVERSIEMVVGLLAILKAGGAYVPIDPSYPAARIRHMLDDSQAPLLLPQSHLTEALSLADLEHDCVVLCLDKTDVAGQPGENLPARSMAEDLAYVIYTSGSTGMPKGVMIAHQALVNHMIWMQNVFAFTSEDKILQKTPFSFDASVWEFYAPLLNGGTMVLLKPEGHTDINLLFASLTQNQITVLQLVPTLLKAMLELNETIPPCLRYLFCGGEAITQEIVLSFDSQAGHTSLYNLYGPTEACIDTSFWECKSSTTVSIGKPIANTRIYILDSQQQIQPPGIPGELCIAGAGLARGYLNRPDLTAEKFIEVELFGKTERIYKTGDLARWLPDGNLEFLGRIDHQIKLRGFRIELGEIEAAISQYEGVKESVVNLYEADGNQRLVAYIVVNGQWTESSDPCSVASGQKEGLDIHGTSLLTTSHQPLVAYLKSRLPDYMIPASFMILDSLPLTPNGKIDRKALPKPGIARSGYEQPDNAMEEHLADIWKQVLKREDVGMHDNFFDLGGHSLLLIQAHSRMRPDYPALRVVDLFTYPTIRTLAVHLQREAQPLPAASALDRQAAQSRAEQRRARQDAAPQRRK